jgi:plastocyanin
MTARARKRSLALAALLAALPAISLGAAIATADSASPRSGQQARRERAHHRGRCVRRHGHRRPCAGRRRGAVGHAPAKPPAALAYPAPAPGASLVQPVPPPPLAVGSASAPAAEAKGPPSEPPPSEPPPSEPPPSEPPAVPHVQVTAVEYAFTLSRTSVPAGKVVLELVNSGQDPHNVNLTPPEGPSQEPIANTPSSAVADVTVALAPGAYTLFCSLPTHEQKGMKATLTVE